MNRRNLIMAALLWANVVGDSPAQQFSTRRPYSSPAAPNRTLTPWYGPRLTAQVAPAPHWVERDWRYSAATGAVRPVGYASPPVAYAPVPAYGDPAACCGATCGTRPSYVPPPVPAVARRPVMPRGHYRGDGLYGQDTVYADGEPVRNFFRYILP